MKIIKAKVWRKIDIQINSKIKYDNPYIAMVYGILEKNLKY